MRLLLDLAKSRPRGSQNKHRKYLQRYQDETGTWQYVMPVELTTAPKPVAEPEVINPVAVQALPPLADDTDATFYAIELSDAIMADKNAAPDWVHEKYPSQQKLVEELRQRPATTLLSLGVVSAASASREFKNQLMLEWKPIIRGVARKNAMAMSETTHWQALADTDASKPRRRDDDDPSRGAPRSMVGDYIRVTTDEFASHGTLTMLTALQGYTPKLGDPQDRFDKLAYTVLKFAVRDRAREEQRHQGAITAFLPDNIAPDNDVRMMSTQPLKPDDAAELARVTPTALTVLATALRGKDLHPTYRRVLAARLWLSDPGGVEAGEVQAHGEYVESRIHHATVNNEAAEYDRRKTWHRNWAGPNGVEAAHATWVDPETEKVVDLREMPEATKRRLFAKWYQHGLTAILKEISKTGVEGKDAVPESVIQSALGLKVHPDSVDRLRLNQKGVALKRYLQLESKLAADSRRRHDGVATDPKLISTDFVPPKPIRQMAYEEVYQRPGVQFFVDNTALAAKLGIDVDTLRGVYTTKHSPFGAQRMRVARNAERYHEALAKLQGMDKRKLTKIATLEQAKATALRAIESKHLPKLHAAAIAYSNAIAALRENQQMRARIRKRYLGADSAFMTQKLKPYQPTVEQKEAIRVSAAEMEKHAAPILKYASSAVEHYRDLVSRKADVTLADQNEARLQVLKVRRQQDAKMALLGYEQKRRSELGKSDTFTSLVDALLSYDLALGQLWAARYAN
jgi:hypothetical protein